MRIFGFLGFLFLTAGLAPSAQAEVQRYGVLLGTNLSSLSVDPDAETGTDSNFLLGVFGEFALSERLFVESQLRYIEKGAEGNGLDPVLAQSGDVSYTFRYFEIPLLVKYKFREGESFRPFVSAGPALAFKIGDGVTVSPRAGSTGVNTGSTASNSIRSVDFSLEFGGGAELYFSDSFALRAQAAYSLGLLDINQTTNNWKTRGLQFTAGISILN